MTEQMARGAMLITLIIAIGLCFRLIRWLWRTLRSTTPRTIGRTAGTVHKGGTGIVRDIVDGFREGMRR